MAGPERRYKPLGSGLPGKTNFSASDAVNGDLIQWDDSLSRWTQKTVASLNGDLDHGTLAGLGDDDHTQYILSDGTRAFSDNILLSDATEAIIDLTTVSATLTLRGRDAGSANSTLATFDPDAEVSLFYDGVSSFETTAQGASFFHTSADRPFIGFYQDDRTTRNGFLQFHEVDGVRLENEVHGTNMILAGEDSGGVNRNLFLANPDGDFELYRAGVKLAFSNGDGILAVERNAAGSGVFQAIDSDGEFGYFYKDNSGPLWVRNFEHSGEIRIFAENAAGIGVYGMIFDPDAAVSLYYGGVEAFQTRVDGIRVNDTSGNDPLIRFYDDSNTILSRIQHLSNSVYVWNETDGNEVILRTDDSGGTSRNHVRVGRNATGTAVGFHNTAPIAKPTVTGSRGGNAALTSLLTALANYGLITNSTT